MKPKPILKTYSASYQLEDGTPYTLVVDRKKPLGKRGVQDYVAKLFGVLRGSVRVISINELGP